MSSNTLKFAGAVGAALVAAGASADLLPDGKLKHALIVGGIVGTFLLSLAAKWPIGVQSADVIDMRQRR